MANIVTLGIEYFPDPVQGRPLAGAKIYVGLPDTDPEILSNQKQVSLRVEGMADVPVDQPVLTSAGGVPQYNGSPAQIVTDGNYSIKVLSSLGGQPYYDPNAFNGNPVIEYDTLQTAINDPNSYDGQNVICFDYAEGNNAGMIFGEWVATGVITPDLGNPAHATLPLIFSQIGGNVATYGGILDGITNDAQSYIDVSARISGSILIPRGTCKVAATTSNSEQILTTLDRVVADGILNIDLDPGTHNYTSQIVINSIKPSNIFINGSQAIDTTATSQVGVSGSAKAYSAIIGVASSIGIAVGDYAIIRRDVTGTGDFQAHAGVWKITAVDSGGANRITVLNTNMNTAFPTNTLTGGNIAILKTVLKFTGVDGFRFEGQALGVLDRVAIVGDYDLAAATGTTGAHGIVTSAPVITGGASSNDDYDTDGTVRLGQDVGISAFGEQGVAVSGRGNMVSNFLSSCSNRKRGIYAEGGHIRCKFAVANGNGEDGFIADTTGFIQAALSTACGNGLNGYWSTNSSFLNCSNSVSIANLTNGFEARGGGRLAADSSEARGNGAKGFLAIDGAMMDADAAIARENAEDGFYAQSNATIDADNSSAINNSQWGYEAEVGSVLRAGGSAATGNGSGDYNHTTDSIVIDNTGAVKDYDWQSAVSIPAFEGVAFTDDGSTIEYKIVDNKTVFWKIRLLFSGLDTADTSTLVIAGLPLVMSGRLGGAQINIRSSTGLTMAATDTYQANYNTTNDRIVFTDSAGGLMKYNSGKIAALGIIEISGWYETV